MRPRGKINGSFQTFGGRTFYVIEGPGVYRRIPAWAKSWKGQR